MGVVALRDGHNPPDITTLAAELLRQGRPVQLPVSGSSMRPSVRPGDLVTLMPVSVARPIEVGEVVAFSPGDGRLVIHRVIRQSGGRLQTQGDGVWAPDPEIESHRVLARVVAVERSGRAVRYGLGRERRLLAWALRRGWLVWLARLDRRVAAGHRNDSASEPGSGCP